MTVSLINISLRAKILAGEELPRWVRRHKRIDYIIAVALSAPPWIKRRDFAKLYAERDLRTAATGVRHVLDHIIPITHPLVCGLTVPWNMKAIDWRANSRKSNGLHHAFQIEMFNEPEQLRIW